MRLDLSRESPDVPIRSRCSTYPQTKGTDIFLRPLRAADLEPLLEPTIATFDPFYEDSFQSIVGDAVMVDQHGTWRADYREMWLGRHNPRNHRHVVVAEDGRGAARLRRLVGRAPTGATASLRSSPWQQTDGGTVSARRCARAFDAMRRPAPTSRRSPPG
ncbi:hypothetical protein ACH495_27350 [Micromonospora sp. NPDC018662]|uniref:hypothetical protein n=1 Tax=Micromonospora sp. NPDC018662 TaxID=3364238 RepID=UPI0037950E70